MDTQDISPAVSSSAHAAFAHSAGSPHHARPRENALSPELADGDGLVTGAPPLPELIPFAFPGLPGVRCAFSTALAGSFTLDPFADGAAGAGRQRATATGNRRRVLGALGLERWVEMKQVHGDTLAADPAPTPLEEAATGECDGVCSTEKELALAVKSADCQPILLTDTRGAAVAALHVGWRGNALNFPGSGVAAFCRRYNLRPEELLAVRGPSLGPGAAEFVNFENEWPAGFQPWFSPATRRMDLWSLTRHQLTEAGLLPGNIFSLDLCTYDLHNMFFSFRRGHQGRMVSLIWRV